MFEAQSGMCAICHQPETVKDVTGQVQRLSIDHDHATGEVRALLCTRHNTMIGMAGEDVRILLSAIEYLDKWKIKS